MNIATHWILAITLALTSAASSQADLIVDSFQTPLSVQNSGGSGGSAPAAGIFGVNRTYSLQVFSGITQQLTINSGQLTLSVSPAANLNDATMRLTYADPTPSENVNQLGLHTLLIEDVVATGNWNVTVTLKDNLDQTSVSSVSALPTNSDFLLELSTFTPTASALGPLKEIGLFFNVAGTAPQIKFGTISIIAVPEPSTLAVIGLTCVAAGTLGRRWKRQRNI